MWRATSAQSVGFRCSVREQRKAPPERGLAAEVSNAFYCGFVAGTGAGTGLITGGAVVGAVAPGLRGVTGLHAPITGKPEDEEGKDPEDGETADD